MSPRTTPNSQQASRQSLGERLMATVQTIEFVWWLGHILTVVFGLLYVINLLLTFSSVSSYYYKAYLGTLLSYALVIYKTHGQPQFNTGFLQRIGSDENVQYFFLALVWYMMIPMFPSLVPFMIFSALHAVHYLSGTLLGVVFPQVPQEVAKVQNHRSGTGRPVGSSGSDPTASLSAPGRFALVLNTVSKNYSARALDAVSLWEVAVVLPSLILSAVTLRGSFLAPFVYVHFLRIRYVMSVKTQRAFHFVRVKLDRFFYPPTAHPSMPPFLTNVYGKARDFVVSFGEKAMQQPSSVSGQREQ